MHTATFARQAGVALVLLAGMAAASAQGGITEAPDKTKGATKQPDTGEVHSVTGPSTTSLSPKKTHKAAPKAKAASAAASK